MSCSEDVDIIRVLNMKKCHDKYMLYAKDLLHETHSRLDRMGNLSREIRYLVNQIQPSHHNQEISRSGTRSRGQTRQTPGSFDEMNGNCRNKNNNTCLTPCFEPKRAVSLRQERRVSCKTKSSHPENWAGENWQGSRSTGISTTTLKTERQKIYQRETSKRNSQQPCNANLVTSVMTVGKSRPLSHAKKDITPTNKNGSSSMKCLKLCVVLPECDTVEKPVDGVLEEASDSVAKSPAAGMFIRRKHISRECMRIPRVVIQSFVAENYFSETRLPKIMENFPPPLQLTARKFRLPALRNQATEL